MGVSGWQSANGQRGSKRVSPVRLIREVQGGGDAMVHVLCLRPSRVAQEGHELCMAYWGCLLRGIHWPARLCAWWSLFQLSIAQSVFAVA